MRNAYTFLAGKPLRNKRVGRRP